MIKVNGHTAGIKLLGSGGDSPVETKELIYSIDESQGGVWINSNIDATQFVELYFEYTDSVSGADYIAKVKIEDIAVYTGGADVYTTVFPAAISFYAFNVRIYNNELYVSFNGVGTNTKVVGVYKKITVKGNATVKQGTFISASSQYGIVDVDCGFEPDMVMVKLPFTGGDTVSYWEKGLSYAQNSAIWCLKPAENVAYEVALDRQSGETGIQAINNNGFSFMSNSGNTQGATCEYIAVKYEAEPIPNPFVIKTYAKFDGSQGIRLPWKINADYKVEVTFYQTEYTDTENIIGNTISGSYSHLSPYQGGYWSSSGSSEGLISNLNWSAGEHTYITNNGNGYNEFDGVEVQSYTPTNADGYYTIGERTGTLIIRSYIKSYKIYSISQGTLLHELVPCLYDGEVPCLYDKVGKMFFYNGIDSVMDTIPTN